MTGKQGGKRRPTVNGLLGNLLFMNHACMKKWWLENEKRGFGGLF